MHIAEPVGFKHKKKNTQKKRGGTQKHQSNFEPEYALHRDYYFFLLVLLSSSDFEAMGDQLESILLDCKVETATAASIVAAGWTQETLAICASTPEDLETHLPDIAMGVELSFQQKACLKLAWHKCQAPLQSRVPAQPNDTMVDQLSQFVDGSWSESFPAKISHAVMVELKAKFSKHYPSEILSYETMPSTRLISQAFHNKQRGDFRWIPWKFRLSQSRVEDLQTTRSSKVPRMEGLQLHNLLLDEPPAVEISNAGMGINAVRTMFDMVNTALALVESAHLASLKSYSIKFMAHLTQKLDVETGLRTPTILEAQSADKQLWHIMNELISEKAWTLDQALHELTHVRGDMAMLLQARPRLSRPAAPAKGGKGVPYNRPPEPSKGSGKKGKKGSAKTGKSGIKWATEAYVDGVRKQLCMRYQTNSCTFSDCKFHHACAVPKADGTACGLAHPANQHDSTPH